MTEAYCNDLAERYELTEPDLAIATLVGRYIERRAQGVPPRVHDLLLSPPSSATPGSTTAHVLAFK
jgi:hypothetical protein